MIRRKEIDSRFQKLNRMIGWRETERAIFYIKLTMYISLMETGGHPDIYD